ncbi:MAG: DUF4832 domain-containing protein [Planctomycetes bacterium]|nr:DUF4832 domain-containing protein [Planctomycetota bacterium]
MEKTQGQAVRTIVTIVAIAAGFYLISYLVGQLFGPPVRPESVTAEGVAAAHDNETAPASRENPPRAEDAPPQAARMLSFRPAETDELFANPGMGWQTFYKAADKDPNLAGLPSSVFYIRYYWADFEKGDGRYDWSVLDGDIEKASRSGQTLAFRVMTTGTNPRRTFSPSYLEGLGCRIHTFKHGQHGSFKSPDFNDPVFLEKHLAFIKVLGGRYNAHPGVCLVDIGSIGLWGEWHMSDTGGLAMPTEENALRIIDAWKAAFPDTPLVMQLDYTPGMVHAAGLAMGWRVDCWGDMGGYSENWCHMRNMYPQNIEKAGVEDLWKRAPVALETCWDMRKWVKDGWDIDHILKWALDHHATFINNKSRPVPAELLPKVRKFLLKVGYRFVVRSVTLPTEIAPGGTLAAAIEWENIGVAPCYYDFHPALALADSSGNLAWSKTFSSCTVRGRLPGAFTIHADWRLPQTLQPGVYRLLVGITDAAGVPRVKIAIDGARNDGWYDVGEITLK